MLRITLLSLFPAASSVAANTQAFVKLQFGTVNGNLLEHSREFLGVPYAGKTQRFAPPEPWTSPYPEEGLDACSYSAQCWANNDFQQNPYLPFSEDCLHLNIYTPRLPTKQPQPVMIWIHGGSFTSGTAMQPLHNGSSLAAVQDVVVVAVNYRLNIFGFPVFQDAAGGLGENNGLRDQKEAMRWVRSNIAAFGGDPEKVTLFGESAGGSSVMLHFLNGRLRDGLFHRAIAQSSAVSSIGGNTREDSKSATAAAAEALGCADGGILTCLRSVSPEELLNASHGLVPGGGPIIDGDIIEGSSLDVIAAGNFSDVPLVMGNDAQEGNLFVYPPAVEGFGGLNNVTTLDDLQCGARAVWSEEVAHRVFELYPALATPSFDNRIVLSEMLSDVMFLCDNRRVARALSSAGGKVWFYSWKHMPSCSPPIYGAFHSSEVAFVFGHPFISPFATTTAQCEFIAREQALANKIGDLWAYFAREGSMDEEWPRFHASREVNIKLDLGLSTAVDTETGYRRGQCDVNDELGLDFTQGYAWLAAVSACQHQRRSTKAWSHSVVV